MPWIGRFKLSDAIRRRMPSGGKKAGKPLLPHEIIAEQVREDSERRQAKNNEASIRDRLVQIGRGILQAGRQG
jgi:hypothetical protein